MLIMVVARDREEGGGRRRGKRKMRMT